MRPLVLACALGVAVSAASDGTTRDDDGAVIRGSRDARRLALVFTGHEFAEGMPTILDELRRVGARGSFFLTGDFVRTPAFVPDVRRAIADGHYVGPHSDRHLLYAGWDAPKPTLVSRAEFDRDVRDNLSALGAFGIDAARVTYWMPSYEWYNAEIVEWAADLGLTTVDFTRGTRANADYMADTDPKFVPSARIAESILDYERRDPDGLNGFILLMHVGAGPARREPLHLRLGGVLDELRRRGYRFVGIDELLATR
ncbi:MAG: polysaccharide deacetylase family protein [Acidobacteria bacterium]|nr:polysaccharide deacetylase family protein [Acidobacteriota bacterium]